DTAEAVAFIESNGEDVDLVLLDLNMPRISGAELFHHIRRHAPQAPILLASGTDEPQLECYAREWGAAGFLHKPFGITVLAQAIRKALDESAERAGASPG